MDYSSDQTETPEAGPATAVPLPTLAEFLHLRFFLGFLRGFLSSWFRSRHYRELFFGIPTLLFAIAGAVTAWQLAKPPGSALAAAYVRAAVNADQIGSYAESDLMWERLMQLRPDDQTIRFQLAISLAEREEFAEALHHLDMLTGENGYAPARLWLVKRSRVDPSAFPLDEEQQIFQLEAVVEDEPNNAEAHRLLAQSRIEQGEYVVAEEHLLEAAKQHPTLGLPLYELQLRLKRDDLTIGLRHLERAAEGFKKLVVRSPEDSQARISWAQSLVYLGKKDRAEAVLTETPTFYDSPELRTAAAEFFLHEAQLLTARSTLNAPRAAKYLVKAAQLQPEHPLLPPLCVALAGMGVRFSDDELAPVLTQLKTILESNAPDTIARLTLAQLLATLGHFADAAELLEADQTEDTRIQSLLVRIYSTAGKVSEAGALTDTMLAALQRNAGEMPDAPGPATELADGLIIAQRYKEAVTMIDAFAERTSQQVHELPPQLRRHYVTASVAAFREIYLKAPIEDSFSFLSNAVKANFVSLQLVQLTATLAYSEGPFAEQAEQMLAMILAKGEANASVYSSLGTLALSSGRLDAAVDHLRLALALAPGSPEVQNNLALALIRLSKGNASEAFQLCEQALQTIPGHPDVLSTRAEIHIAIGHWDEARMDLEVALPQRQASELVRVLLINVYTALEDTQLVDAHKEALESIQEEKSKQTAPDPSVN
ncbi:MAG: tetratricopeptide repeat protein [Planctomycetaceae bacterium]